MRKWKDLFQKKWMVWLCGPDIVYYLKATKRGFKWVTLHDINDAGDCVYFDQKKDVRAFINDCIANDKMPPEGNDRLTTCNRFEYSLVMPSLEDGKFWYEGAGKSYNRYLKEKK
jgi:hypothetical protein